LATRAYLPCFALSVFSIEILELAVAYTQGFVLCCTGQSPSLRPTRRGT
jgi:hypothetical protein